MTNIAHDTALAAGTWTLDPARTTVTFTTHAFFVVPVHGTFPVQSGSVVVDPDVTKSHAEGVVESAGVNTNNSKRDTHLRTKDYLETDTHPTITYRTTAVREAAKGWTAEGVLTVHGVDAPVTLAVELVASTTDSATLRATGTLSRSAHGVSKMKPMVPDKVAVDITAYLTR